MSRSHKSQVIGACLATIIVAVSSARALALPKPEQVVQLTSTALVRPLSANSPNTLLIRARVAPGWHINSDHPANPDYIATTVKLRLPPGIELTRLEFPAARIEKLSFAGDEKLSVFSGLIEVGAALHTAADFKPAPQLPANIEFNYQACNDSQCLRPATISLPLDLSQTPIETGSGEVEPLSTGAHAESSSALANAFKTHGYGFGFLLVLLGGLALNLTPCVYPLIGVTLAYFGNQGSGGSRQVAILASLYVLGIALMFSAVGVTVALSGGLFGAALSNPIVLGAIALMLLVLAASSFGLFSIQPPQWMMSRAGIARPGFLGALVMGLGMGVVAAPCIGPVVLGLLLMVEQSRSPLFGFALFFTLAVGMGAPYVALAMAAGNVRKLPRSGQWLGWIENLFGFVLVGLALYFLDPVVPGRLISQLLPYYAIAVALYLGLISRLGNDWRPFRIAKSTLGIAAIVLLVWRLVPRGPQMMLDFSPFDGSLLNTASEEKKPVLIDFSADWCIPCREMEATTFKDPTVYKEASRFVRLRADLTHQDASSSALVKRFEIQGVPTVVFMDSSGKIRTRLVGYIGPNQFLSNLKQID